MKMKIRYAFEDERVRYKAAAIAGLASVSSGGHTAAQKINHADELADLAVASDIARFEKFEAEDAAASEESAPKIEVSDETPESTKPPAPKAPEGTPPAGNVAGGA